MLKNGICCNIIFAIFILGIIWTAHRYNTYTGVKIPNKFDLRQDTDDCQKIACKPRTIICLTIKLVIEIEIIGLIFNFKVGLYLLIIAAVSVSPGQI